MSDEFPQQVDGLEVNEVPDGVVVYQPATDEVHYLNATAAATFLFSDGTRSVADLADVLQATWKLDGAPTAEVEACLAEFRTKGLVR